MTNQEILELMTRFDQSSLTALRFTDESFSLELQKGGAVAAVPTAAPTVPAPVPAATPVKAAKEDGGTVITAPLVGTYYAAPAREGKPFVTAGETVKKGQTLCLIEAMKMLSEVPAPCDCTITAILKENGTLAAFGEPLFRYEPC